MIAKPSAAYPFVTRREIVGRFESEPAFVAECASILQARTEQRAAGRAPAGKPWGWMSSECVVAGRLAAKSKIGMLSIDEEVKLAKLVSRYSRQLADHFRALTLVDHPGLSAAAEKFGVLPGRSTLSDISQVEREPQEKAEQCHPSGASEPDVLEEDIEANSEPVQEDELAPRVMEFVQRMPGERTEFIAGALGTTTAMLAPTLRMMVQGRRLKKQGFGRGTRYFVR